MRLNNFKKLREDGARNLYAAMYTQPTEEQLAKINQFTPANMEPLEAGEVAVVEYIATDNFLNRAFGKWAYEDLPRLAELILGKPLTLDHDWDEAFKAQGLIFDAEVQDFAQAPEWAIQQADNADNNRAIAKKEGYRQLIVQVAVPISSQILIGQRFGYLSSVSLGGFRFKECICPLCDISFEDKDCPHCMPDSWYGWTPDKDPRIAPYYIRSGVFDLGELSLVLMPNVPTAGVVSRQKSETN